MFLIFDNIEAILCLFILMKTTFFKKFNHQKCFSRKSTKKEKKIQFSCF